MADGEGLCRISNLQCEKRLASLMFPYGPYCSIFSKNHPLLLFSMNSLLRCGLLVVMKEATSIRSLLH